jgi:hypothetical protein
VARFTAACCTPGTFVSARSTRATQLAQVMPPMPRSTVEVAVDVFMIGSLKLSIMARSSLLCAKGAGPWLSP